MDSRATKIRERMNYIMENIRCGTHSGFPACCIFWHTFVWINPLAGNMWEKGCNMLYTSKRNTWKAKYLRAADNFMHIPCPLCLLRNNTKIPIICSCIAND